jgi:hypothetical protein
MRLRDGLRSHADGVVISPCSGAPTSSGNAAQQPEQSGPFASSRLPFSTAAGAMDAMDSGAASGRFASGELMSMPASMMTEAPERASTMALPLHSTQVHCAAEGHLVTGSLLWSAVLAWLPLPSLSVASVDAVIAPPLTWCFTLQIVLAPRSASVPEVPMLPAHLAGGHPSLVRRAAGVKGIGRSAGARSSGLEVTAHPDEIGVRVQECGGFERRMMRASSRRCEPHVQSGHSS